jgi:hypothetical protein
LKRISKSKVDEVKISSTFYTQCCLENHHAFSNNLCHNELVGSSKQGARLQNWLGDNYEKGDLYWHQ